MSSPNLPRITAIETSGRIGSVALACGAALGHGSRGIFQALLTAGLFLASEPVLVLMGRRGDAARGAVQVAYAREMPAFEEGPFLQEERNLIEEVAHQVGLSVGRWEDALAKAKLFHMLEQRRE